MTKFLIFNSLKQHMRIWRFKNWKNFSKQQESLLAVRNQTSLLASTSEPLPGIEPDPLLSQCAPYTKGVPIGLPPYSQHNSCAITRQSAYPHFLSQWQLWASQYLSLRRWPPLKHWQSKANGIEIQHPSSNRCHPANRWTFYDVSKRWNLHVFWRRSKCHTSELRWTLGHFSEHRYERDSTAIHHRI